jgi:hypothetical protein
MVTRRQYRALEARVEALERESERRAETSRSEAKVFYTSLADAVSREIVGKSLCGRQTGRIGTVARFS